MEPETFAAQFDVSRETLTRLLAYQALLGRWQQRINLVGPATLDDFWARHAADSAQLLALACDQRIWLDLGSGGGFPGLIVAIMLTESGGHVHLVESDGRKAAFADSFSQWDTNGDALLTSEEALPLYNFMFAFQNLDQNTKVP